MCAWFPRASGRHSCAGLRGSAFRGPIPPERPGRARRPPRPNASGRAGSVETRNDGRSLPAGGVPRVRTESSWSNRAIKVRTIKVRRGDVQDDLLGYRRIRRSRPRPAIRTLVRRRARGFPRRRSQRGPPGRAACHGQVPVHADEPELQAKIQRQVDSLKEEGVAVSLRLVQGGAPGTAHAIALWPVSLTSR